MEQKYVLWLSAFVVVVVVSVGVGIWVDDVKNVLLAGIGLGVGLGIWVDFVGDHDSIQIFFEDQIFMEVKKYGFLLAAFVVSVGFGAGLGLWVDEKNALLAAVSVGTGLGLGLGKWVDEKNALWAALSVGTGLGVGLGIWVDDEKIALWATLSVATGMSVRLGIWGDHDSNQIFKDYSVMEQKDVLFLAIAAFIVAVGFGIGIWVDDDDVKNTLLASLIVGTCLGVGVGLIIWVDFGDKSKGSKKDMDIKASSKSDIICSNNAYEEGIRQELVPADKIEVTFSDIGALDDVKESLHEAVMLPLRRPDLFKGNGILKPCKGVLLFGPPGTGKTMLAKAIANEAGASFINVSSSTITHMWLGQAEKSVRALFSVAAKVAPTIIFIDEVDSMLAQRGSNSECNAMRRITNEFMSHWDGLLSKPDGSVVVLGATNRPFDLDDAVIRRFQRRIMVGLPSAENRETILKTLLAKDKHEDIDFKELSTMTEGYSGSDLKNLCMTAVYRPLKELLQQEKEKEMKKREKVEEAETSKDASNATEEDQVVALRPLNMEDMRQAKIKVAASFAVEGSVMKRLKEWNDLYGEAASR